ncbi:hypothetical protein FGO68_gene4741 [Halteria grandinella]|uniref:Uncharacterized protein n=1 Tax=Halteria grandinella TaxID=5974 RepID=A0A8J8SWA4_HALGN|nr:hypothetical protein FGO68_gene4741 [Halteria grandinella]
MQSIVTFMILFTDNYNMACLFVFLIGFSVTGKQYVGWNYLLEMQPKSKSVVIGTACFIAEGFVFIAITIFFKWICKQWHYVLLPTVLFGMLGSVFLYLQPESPKWLVSVGKYQEARKSLNKIAEVNGLGTNVADKFVFPKEKAHGNAYLELIAEKEQKRSEAEDEMLAENGGSHDIDGSQIRELCKNPRYCSNLFFSAVIWCALIINYYVVAFYLKYFPGDIFQNTFFMAVADIMSYAVSALVVKKLGLILSVIISLSTAGLGSVLYLFYFHYVSLIPLFIVLCRIGNSMLLNIMYLTNQTLFPTQFQSSSFGILNFISHVSAVAAPIIAELSDPYPFFLYLLNCVLAILSSFFLRQISKLPSNETESGEKSSSQ